MSLTSFIAGLAARSTSTPSVSYPYLDTREPEARYIEVWPTGATTWRALVAYNPQNGNNGGNRTGVHIVVDHDFQHGRLARKRDDALCKPRRAFWDLAGLAPRAHVSCKACRRMAAVHGIDLTVEPVAVGTGDLWERVDNDGSTTCFFVTEFEPVSPGSTIEDVFVRGWYVQNTAHGPRAVLPYLRALRAVDFARSSAWRLIHRNGGPAARTVHPGDVIRIAR